MKEKIIDAYRCHCGWKTKRVHRAHYPVIPCKKCGGNAHLQWHDEISSDPDKRRKPLTEQQRRLLGFYRNERAWHRDIEDRAIAPDGSIVRRSEATKLFK